MIDTAIRGIVFDLDGVLIQSAPSHAAAFEQVFARCGIHDFEYAPYAGWRTLDVVRDVLVRRGRSVEAEAIAEMAHEKSRLARELLEASHPLAANCEAKLAELAGGFHLGLASSGSRSSVEAFLKLTGSRSLFRSVLSGQSMGSYARRRCSRRSRVCGRVGRRWPSGWEPPPRRSSSRTIRRRTRLFLTSRANR